MTASFHAPADLVALVDALLAAGGRRILGVVGPPGAGKSSLVEALHAARPEHTVVVPMDGFHLAQAALSRLGRADRKGAPDTFDAAGYVALLRRLRTQRPGDPTVYAPAFRRDLEEPIAGAIAVDGQTPLVLTEGNYLLLDEGDWRPVAACLDDCWYVGVDASVRRRRLLGRHQRFGRSLAEAQTWAAQVDEPNARMIEATRSRASRVVAWGESMPPQGEGR